MAGPTCIRCKGAGEPKLVHGLWLCRNCVINSIIDDEPPYNVAPLIECQDRRDHTDCSRNCVVYRIENAPDAAGCANCARNFGQRSACPFYWDCRLGATGGAARLCGFAPKVEQTPKFSGEVMSSPQCWTCKKHCRKDDVIVINTKFLRRPYCSYCRHVNEICDDCIGLSGTALPGQCKFREASGN